MLFFIRFFTDRSLLIFLFHFAATTICHLGCGVFSGTGAFWLVTAATRENSSLFCIRSKPTRDSLRRIVRPTHLRSYPNRGISPCLSFLPQTASDSIKPSLTRTLCCRHNQRTLLPLFSVLQTENFSPAFFLITSPDSSHLLLCPFYHKRRKKMHLKTSPV